MARQRRSTAGPTKRQRELMAEMMQMGTDKLQEKIESNRVDYDDAKLKRELEAESVLFFFEYRGTGISHFKDRKCKWCGDPFMHTHMGVGYCSDSCRKEAIEAVGGAYNPEGKTMAERWGGRIRKIIGPEAKEMLDQWLEINPKVRLATNAVAEPEPEIKSEADLAQERRIKLEELRARFTGRKPV